MALKRGLLLANILTSSLMGLIHRSYIFAGDRPSLDLLWFGTGPDVSALRLTSFLTIFDCQELSELDGQIEASMLVALCLVTYIVLKVRRPY